jgi:hypothetical protein
VRPNRAPAGMRRKHLHSPVPEVVPETHYSTLKKPSAVPPPSDARLPSCPRNPLHRAVCVASGIEDRSADQSFWIHAAHATTSENEAHQAPAEECAKDYAKLCAREVNVFTNTRIRSWPSSKSCLLSLHGSILKPYGQPDLQLNPSSCASFGSVERSTI